MELYSGSTGKVINMAAHCLIVAPRFLNSKLSLLFFFLLNAIWKLSQFHIRKVPRLALRDLFFGPSDVL